MPTLQDFVPVESALGEIRHALKGDMSVDTALVVARNAVKTLALKNLTAHVEPGVQNAYDMHVMTKGELPASARLFEREAWIEGFDEAVMSIFDTDALRDVVSASWLGTLDAKTPINQDGVAKLASNFANEAYRNLTWLHDKDEGKEKTAAQVLSSVGIVRSDLEALLGNLPTITEQKETKSMYDQDLLFAEIRETAAMFGIEGVNLRNALDSASDDDTILSDSGFAALGVPTADGRRETLQMARMAMGFDDLFKAIKDGGAALLAVSPADGVNDRPADPPPPPVKPDKLISIPANTERGMVPTSVLSALKEHSGLKSEALATGVGASRSTFDNYAKGKASLKLTAENKTFLLSILRERAEIFAREQAVLERAETV